MYREILSDAIRRKKIKIIRPEELTSIISKTKLKEEQSLGFYLSRRQAHDALFAAYSEKDEDHFTDSEFSIDALAQWVAQNRHLIL